MEDVLDLYHNESDQKNPWVCFDESCKQLVKETNDKTPAEPGKPERYRLLAEVREQGIGNRE